MSAPSPLVDFFRRGEAARDVRLLAAQGGFAPRAQDQLNILVLLVEDPDPEIRGTANDTISRIPTEALSTFLAGAEVADIVREFFAARGIAPAAAPAAVQTESPLIETGDATDEDDDLLTKEAATDAERASVTQKLSKMTFPQRLKAAVKGSREVRAILVRDTNKMISAAVMSSPKMTEQEVESIARMASVSEDVLRIIAMNRAWIKNYKIALGLVKNPKTPVAISMNLLQRISERDLAQLVVDRNVPEPLRIAAKKKTTAGKH